MMHKHKPIALMLGVGMAIASLLVSIPSVLIARGEPSPASQDSFVAVESSSPSPTASIPPEFQENFNQFNEAYGSFSDRLNNLLEKDDYQGLSSLLEKIETSRQALSQQVQTLDESEHKASINQALTNVQTTIAFAQVSNLLGIEASEESGQELQRIITEFLKARNNDLKTQRDALQAALNAYGESLSSEAAPELSPETTESEDTSFTENLQNPTFLGAIGLASLVFSLASLILVLWLLYQKTKQVYVNLPPNEGTDKDISEEEKSWIKPLIEEAIDKKYQDNISNLASKTSNTIDDSVITRIKALEDSLKIIEKALPSIVSGNQKVKSVQQPLSSHEHEQFTSFSMGNVNERSLVQESILVEALDQIAECYNSSPNTLREYIIATVSETQESQGNSRVGKSKEHTFHPSSQGIYWVLDIDNYYYLVPRANLKLNSHNYDNLKASYDCQGEDYSRPVQLIKAALVVRTGDSWQLQERGSLTFQ